MCLKSGELSESGCIHSDVLIAGGGPAGMMAAIGARHAARLDGCPDDRFVVTLLERNPRAGVKIRISGGGKCNVTHEGSVGELLSKGFRRKGEQRFLRRALHAFSNRDLAELLLKRGVGTAARDDGKVFPVSERSEDVLAALEEELRDANVSVVTGERVLRAETAGGGFVVYTAGRVYCAKTFVLATGGLSWSRTGTTGDGLGIAGALGHRIVPPSPALAPVFLKPPPSPSLAGISLRDVVLVIRDSKHSFSRRGDLLFTHKGISGPACLSISRDAAGITCGEGAEAGVDFFPGETVESLDSQLIASASTHGGQLVKTFLRHKTPVPLALVHEVLRRSGIAADQRWGELKKTARRSLLQTLKFFRIGELEAIPLDAGEVSAGGISLDETDSKTMESRIRKGLFFCGEILDYAAEIGGFNLQAAFSTGWLAGLNCYPVQE